jgi:hypothetical protein
MGIVEIAFMLLISGLSIASVYVVYKAHTKIVASDNRLTMLGVYMWAVNHAKCEVCGKEVGYNENTRAVRITKEPYLKVLCPHCAKTHAFYPIMVDSEDKDESCYGIDYMVLPTTEEDKKKGNYLRLIK